MNNKIIIGIVVVVLVVVGVLFFNKKGSLYSNPQPTQGTQTTTEASAANTVAIQNFAFSPATLTVKAGTTVTWINKDSANHAIKSDTFNSPSLAQGETFKFTFTNKGSFSYICSIHPTMQGKIIVE